ncbi:MAG: VOC family protein [Hamadaea sp.]|nr:VOC family protein [Hamadaea sp.]
MGLGLSKIKHIKLPVTDVRRSVSWYREVFDLELFMEFAEQGEIRGASLLDRDGGYEIALRQREHCASKPDLTGFDAFALTAADRETLVRIAERCDRLEIAHSGVRDVPGFASSLDIPDPDGTVVRLHWRDPAAPDRFLGVDTDAAGTMVPYFTPRL